MSSTDSFTEVARAIRSARTFANVFGSLGPGDAITRRSGLRKQFGYLAKMVHPDLVATKHRTDAAEVFKLLNTLRHAAEEAIQQNTYDAPFGSTISFAESEDGGELVSPAGTYRLKVEPLCQGDFSVLYRGTKQGAKPELVLAKVASDPTSNAWLEKEAALLRTIAGAKPDSAIAGIRRFLPQIKDTFLFVGEKNTRYRTTISVWVPDMVSITDIMKAYPAGLDPSEAWPLRRIIAQTLAASMLGVVHGAIVPDHVLVDPFKHEPLHIGWAHAVKKGEKITQIIDRWRDCYPPEVFAKKAVDHRTDIYMAGATIVKLLGGSVERKSLPAAVPKELATLVLRCLENSPKSRPQDGLELLNEFTRVIRKIWGRNYRVLTIPNS